MPAYIVASRDDHIVPWRSAYRSTRLLGGDVTFVLGASGHIAGVVNPPAKNRRNYWTNPLLAGCAPTTGSRARKTHPGSWWPHWGAWLARHGGALAPGAARGGQRRPSPARAGTRPLRARAVRVSGAALVPTGEVAATAPRHAGLR